ncbi:hypothetical protein C0J52_02326 [Blattella germanica]|nr:hypothetical protein C0J52_02326 [Blattella germanica]
MFWLLISINNLLIHRTMLLLEQLWHTGVYIITVSSGATMNLEWFLTMYLILGHK